MSAHENLEPSAERVDARASWTAATESSQSPLLGRTGGVGGGLGDYERRQSQSGDFADSVTSEVIASVRSFVA